MQDTNSSVLTRDDTFFGVCEAIGEDLGINAQLLRLGFALALWRLAVSRMTIRLID